jgi:hypothetical protein
VLLALAIALVPGIRSAHADIPAFTISSQSNAEGATVALALEATGTAPFTYTLASGALPSGLSLTGASISGTIANGAATAVTNGVYSISITATESSNPVDSTTAPFTWTVTNPLPIIAAIGSRTTEEGVADSLQLAGSDPDGDVPLAWSVMGLPPGLSFGAYTGLVEGIVGGGAVGTYTVVVKLTDFQNGESTSTFTWTVTDPHPSIGAILPRSDAENSVVSGLQVIASGPADHPLEYGAAGLPTGLTINPSTGLISGTIATGAAQGGASGVWTVTVTVNNAHGSASTVFLWTVTNPATAPVFTSAPTNAAQTVNEGAGLAAIQATGTPPLTFSLTSGTLPAGIYLSASGAFSGVTSMQSAGIYSVTVRVSSGSLSASRALTITVVEATPPAFASATRNTAQTVNEGEGLTALLATDPCTTSPVYALVSGTLPAGITLNTNGGFSGVVGPQAAASSPYTVSIRVAETAQATLSTQTTLVITVVDITPPVFSGALTNTLQIISEGQGLRALEVTDPDRDPLTFTRTSGTLPAGISLTTSGSFSGLAIPGSAGTYSVTIQVSDGKLTATANMLITVNRGGGLKTGITVIITIGQGTATTNGVAGALDAPPFITNGRTMVPLRFISESLGAQVEWNALSRTVTVQGGGNTIVLTVGVSTAMVNGQARSLEAPPQIVGGRTFVPLRFINESLGARVDYNSATRSITITR